MKAILVTASLLLSAGFVVSCKKEAIGKPYPLTTCIISGEKLGGMGDPVELVKNGQQVKFCCAHCIPDFEKDSEKYLKEIAAKAGK
jgi:hypothetical protein